MSRVRFVKAVAALVLISAGGFLVYRGLHEYVSSQTAQEEAAFRWNRVVAPSSKTARRQALMRAAPIPEGTTFSRLEVPRLGESLYVVEGDSTAALRKGPGHVRGSAMPGETGNCVIAGHRDLHFRFLKNIEPGDKVYMETAAGKFCYRVTGAKIITPDQIQVLQPTRDAELHLITCYPFYFLGHAPKRFVVTAELIGLPADSGSKPMLVAQAVATARAQVQPAVRHARKVQISRTKPMVAESELRRQRSLEATRALNRAAAAGL